MPLHALHHHEGTFDHECARCGVVREGLPIDPTKGHLWLWRHPTTGLALSISTTPCPTCAQETDQWGQPILCNESFPLHIPDHEVGEGAHPDSLVGLRFEDTGGVVTEHTHGYSLDPETVAHKRLIRALQAHPHFAPHVPGPVSGPLTSEPTSSAQ